jgi:hypothetical protein
MMLSSDSGWMAERCSVWAFIWTVTSTSVAAQCDAPAAALGSERHTNTAWGRQKKQEPSRLMTINWRHGRGWIAHKQVKIMDAI